MPCVLGSKIESRNRCLARKLVRFSSVREKCRDVHVAAWPTGEGRLLRVAHHHPTRVPSSLFERGMFGRSQPSVAHSLFSPFILQLSVIHLSYNPEIHSPQFHICFKAMDSHLHYKS